MAKYVCTICGYVAEGSIPEFCPVCGHPRGTFKPMEHLTET